MIPAAKDNKQKMMLWIARSYIGPSWGAFKNEIVELSDIDEIRILEPLKSDLIHANGVKCRY